MVRERERELEVLLPPAPIGKVSLARISPDPDKRPRRKSPAAPRMPPQSGKKSAGRIHRLKQLGRVPRLYRDGERRDESMGERCRRLTGVAGRGKCLPLVASSPVELILLSQGGVYRWGVFSCLKRERARCGEEDACHRNLSHWRRARPRRPARESLSCRRESCLARESAWPLLVLNAGGGSVHRALKC